MADGEDDRIYRIGGWRFDAAAGELARDGKRRRLEDRAARTLELLARAQGRVLARQEIHDVIWGGRALSPNSLAVVIADLRQALGDDDHQIIETVPKRGYRLMGAAAPPGLAPAGADAPPARPDRRLALALSVTGVLVAMGAGAMLLAPKPGLTLGVGEVANETGQAAFQPLARSVSQLILTDLGRRGGAALVRGQAPARGHALNLESRLAMWSGQPTVYLSAVDARTGKVVWSGMALGPEDDIPANLDKALTDFAAKVK